MSIANGTSVSFRKLSPQAFSALREVNGGLGGLAIGAFYFVGSIIYLATGTNTVEIYGGVQINNAPDDPADADSGVFYYDELTNILKIAINDKWVHLTDAVSGIAPGTGLDEGKFVIERLDGSKTTLDLPFIQSLNDGNINNTTHVPSVKAIADWVKNHTAGFIGAVHWKGQLPANLAAITPPPESGWLYKTDEGMSFETQSVKKGDWILFKSATEFDIFEGIENAAIDEPTQGDHISPLSAHGAYGLQTRINNLDENKIDKIEDAVGGRFAITGDDGSVEESSYTATNSIDMTGGASSTKLTSEQSVAAEIGRVDTELEGKLDLLNAGEADRIITSNADGSVKRGLTVGNSLNTTTPSEGVVLNEVAIKNALDEVKAAVQLEWIVS